MTNKILIVDDYLDNLQILGSIIKLSGYKPITVSNPIEALRYIHDTNDVDLILLDIMMPDMNGFELCKEIRKIKKYDDVPIIFVTALTDTNSIVEGFASGANEYVSKPFVAEEIMARVRNMLSIKESIKQKEMFITKLKDAERAESLFTVSSAIAHNFNNLMQVISGNLELISFKVDNPNLKKNFDESFKALENAISLTKKMLYYTGQAYNFSNTFNLIDKLKEIGANLKEYLPLDFEIIGEENRIEIVMNEKMFEDIINSFLMNAIESKNKLRHSVKLRYKLTNKIPEGILHNFTDNNDHSFIRIDIIDNGCGISEENLKRIFEPFFSTKFIGRGLGLPSSLGLLKTFNCALDLKTSKEGSTFTIYLPLKEQE
ncbi:MAG: response regulator [Candidatus Delongbacteria bacterium]|nr:response regulator [Candidatus Delongbacteria bacterium]MBN2835484.1 response regulator [Candidatus Delongbacteria bacterium]